MSKPASIREAQRAIRSAAGAMLASNLTGQVLRDTSRTLKAAPSCVLFQNCMGATLALDSAGHPHVGTVALSVRQAAALLAFWTLRGSVG
jgi:hypothetical protein